MEISPSTKNISSNFPINPLVLKIFTFIEFMTDDNYRFTYNARWLALRCLSRWSGVLLCRFSILQNLIRRKIPDIPQRIRGSKGIPHNSVINKVKIELFSNNYHQKLSIYRLKLKVSRLIQDYVPALAKIIHNIALLISMLTFWVANWGIPTFLNSYQLTYAYICTSVCTYICTCFFHVYRVL